jgi:hypothetical protein
LPKELSSKHSSSGQDEEKKVPDPDCRLAATSDLFNWICFKYAKHDFQQAEGILAHLSQNLI